MHKKSFIPVLFAILISSFFLNVYGDSTIIGNQVWQIDNLSVIKYNNGDPILYIDDPDEWNSTTVGAYCYYENDAGNGSTHGVLYNWHAVNDPRGIAPAGWRVPSKADIDKLIEYLGGDRIAGHKLKSNFGWMRNGNGTNESGFSGLPGGKRHFLGNFQEIGIAGVWWTVSEDQTADAHYFELRSDKMDIIQGSGDKRFGFSVRLINDKPAEKPVPDPVAEEREITETRPSTPKPTVKPEARKIGIYIKGLIGSSSISDFTAERKSDGYKWEFRLDSGMIYSISAGYTISRFRIELEYLMQSNDLEYNSVGHTTVWSGDTGLTFKLLNGYFDFSNQSIFTPFLSIGAGSVNADFVYEGSDTLSASDTVYHFGLGFEVNIGDMAAIGLQYRKFSEAKFEFYEHNYPFPYSVQQYFLFGRLIF